MTRKNMSRRDLLKVFTTVAVGVEARPWVAWAADADVPVIKIFEDKFGGRWYWDPVGLYVQKGQTVRWFHWRWTATVTAFHPSNDNHELRIPEGAKPFDSGPFIGNFEWTFDVEGTYDYFSRNHEILGTVGRIVVGKPGGPAEKPPGYGGREGRAVMFPMQAKVLATIPSQEIVAKKTIPFPKDLLVRPYPY